MFPDDVIDCGGGGNGAAHQYWPDESHWVFSSWGMLLDIFYWIRH